MTWLITGAAGGIGLDLAPRLAALGIPLRLTDLRPSATVPAGAEFVPADLRDQQAVTAAAEGASVVVHLGGLSQEAPLAEMLQHNITGTHHVLEAAHRHRVPRVVLASSHHVVGMHPAGHPLSPGAELAPDSFYAVSKVAVEALGQLYARKFGLEVVALRIGSHRPRPIEPRHAATWLSPRDSAALIYAAATRPLPQPYLSVFGTSDNPGSWWPRTGWDVLGYQPVDCAADHPRLDPPTDRWQGGAFAESA
ncbi:NAD-dependent epimerase/dehydratase family protein [Streptomyces sp. NRRL S-350]|uniref:NAD-dependent epimerase/dehydratase family protein n=1 Tax=Streptomyces sp. NRRL S-350 TaxID=1463902 RepID=UPI0004C181C5|nr:NAD(P)-dependent oxidoreductase [Streptomyces sp. NRRL S-350]